MNKLEQLLNSLIEKGFRPFGRYDKLMGGGRFGSRQFVKFGIFPEEEFTLRELVSINSGLWQFVCENELYPPYIQHRRFRDLPTNGLQIHDYRYWIIESALCDEDKLEDFILYNVKID